jgi:hypothetical protein
MITAIVVVNITTPMPVANTCQIVCKMPGEILVKPAQYPHQQQDGDGNAEQPQQASASHFDLLVLMQRQRRVPGRVPP